MYEDEHVLQSVCLASFCCSIFIPLEFHIDRLQAFLGWWIDTVAVWLLFWLRWLMINSQHLSTLFESMMFEFILQNHLVPSWKDDPIPLLQSIHDVRFPTIYDRKIATAFFVVSLPSRINTVVGRNPAPVSSSDIQNPVNTGIFAISIGAGFLPSTVKCILIHNHLRLIQRGSNRQQLLGIDTKNGLENCIFFQLCLFWGGIFVKF